MDAVYNFLDAAAGELTRVTGLAHPVALGWLWLMAIAFIIALVASMPVSRPLSSWLGDFFVRWGLAGILVWFVINSFWALKELLNMRLVVPFTPLEGYLEYATVWGAVLTGLATFAFFGTALITRAIFDKGELPKGVIYYKREIFIATSQPVGVKEAESGKEAEREPLAGVDVSQQKQQIAVVNRRLQARK